MKAESEARPGASRVRLLNDGRTWGAASLTCACQMVQPAGSGWTVVLAGRRLVRDGDAVQGCGPGGRQRPDTTTFGPITNQLRKER